MFLSYILVNEKLLSKNILSSFFFIFAPIFYKKPKSYHANGTFQINSNIKNTLLRLSPILVWFGLVLLWFSSVHFNSVQFRSIESSLVESNRID